MSVRGNVIRGAACRGIVRSRNSPLRTVRRGNDRRGNIRRGTFRIPQYNGKWYVTSFPCLILLDCCGNGPFFFSNCANVRFFITTLDCEIDKKLSKNKATQWGWTLELKKIECVCFNEIIWLIIMKMKIIIKKWITQIGHK